MSNSENVLASVLRNCAQLPPDSRVEIHEEPHCPDPSCPLRHTVIAWTDTSGLPRRLIIVKPLVYLQKTDIERALRLASLEI